MRLPVSSNYLAAALQDGYRVDEMSLAHHRLGELLLPTGHLVACDPFVLPDMEPFSLKVPSGSFPLLLSVAEVAQDQRIAFASIRFRLSSPLTWEMMTVGKQDSSTLKEGEIFGYPVDAGTGCFMDRTTGLNLTETMREKPDFYEVLIAEMDKTYRDTWSWLDMKFGDGNLIAFSSGYGDGVYASYAGFDSGGEVSIVVTDFGVVQSEKILD